jgi:hypothetical protein
MGFIFTYPVSINPSGEITGYCSRLERYRAKTSSLNRSVAFTGVPLLDNLIEFPKCFT